MTIKIKKSEIKQIISEELNLLLQENRAEAFQLFFKAAGKFADDKVDDTLPVSKRLNQTNINHIKE